MSEGRKLGAVVRSLRLRKRVEGGRQMSQARLAADAGIHLNTIWRLEKGVVDDPEAIGPIARALGVSESVLRGYVGQVDESGNLPLLGEETPAQDPPPPAQESLGGEEDGEVLGRDRKEALLLELYRDGNDDVRRRMLEIGLEAAQARLRDGSPQKSRAT